MLGAAAVLGRLLSRSAHALRRHDERPNLHYCDWIRGWTDTCLQVYGELAERNPAFLAQFDREEAAERVADARASMRHLKTMNQKRPVDSRAGAERATATRKDVVALQRTGVAAAAGGHIPLGCSLVFSPGWEADRTGGTAGLCQPVERDLFDCHIGCFWPAQVPDQLNHAPDWTAKCAAAQKDWRKIDLIFP